MIFRSNRGGGRDPRQQMIDETSAWLTWAQDNKVETPRIPTARVDKGGFTKLLQSPGSRAAVYHWWSRSLEIVNKLKPGKK